MLVKNAKELFPKRMVTFFFDSQNTKKAKMAKIKGGYLIFEVVGPGENSSEKDDCPTSPSESSPSVTWA